MPAFVLILATLLVAGCGARQGGGTPGEQQASQVDARRRAAQVRVDVAALEEVLHDDLVYRHSDGRIETKRDLIASLRSGKVDYREIRVRAFAVVPCLEPPLAGHAQACVEARQILDVVAGGERFVVEGCYRAQYESDQGGMQMRTYRSALLAEDGTCPLP